MENQERDYRKAKMETKRDGKYAIQKKMKELKNGYLMHKPRILF